MSQRFTLDRSSFEQFLAAASLLQQFQKRAFEDRADAQPLWELVDLQRGIDRGSLDLNTVIQQTPRLAWQLVGASGAGIWLFNDEDEFIWRAGHGPSQTDERLRLEVLSRLAAFDENAEDWRSANRNWDAGYYPGCVKSLMVEPVRQGHEMAGAIAVFSMEFDAFTEREVSKVRLLATLVGYALQRSAQMGKPAAATLQPAELRELIDREIPGSQDVPGDQDGEPDDCPVGDYAVDNSEPGAAVSEAEEPLFAYQMAQTTEPIALSPSQQRQDIERGDLAQDTTQIPSVADIYVPGIGVRAALGGEDPAEPSRGWTGVSSSISGTAAAIAGIFVLLGRGLRNATVLVVTLLYRGLRNAAVFGTNAIVHVAKGTGHGIGKAAHYRPKLPSFPTASIRSQLGEVQARCRSSIRSAGSSWRKATRRLPRPSAAQPILRINTVQQRTHSAEAWTGKRMRAVGRALRDAPNVVSNMPALPTDKIGRALSTFGRSLSTTAGMLAVSLADGAKSFGNELSRLRVPDTWQWNVNPRLVRRVAPAIVVLVVMLAFLFAQAGLHRNVQVASASTSVSVPPAAAILPAAKLTPVSSPRPALDSSLTHRQITDPEIKTDVENMTRYEIATVRRAAQYGDDVAAFQLGMAYEIGYGMTQNCTKAAEWVTRAANDGNPAAEYNLALRYKDGDGVAPNPIEAANWMKKAAEHKYGNASSLLASISNH